MARGLHRLSARKAESIKKVGMHGDGGGLHLRVQQSGSKSWIFVFRWNGKRREMGLGGADSVPLARAREKASTARAMVSDGEDPIAAKKATRAIPTFGEMADDFITAQSKTTTNAHSIARWKRAVGEGDSGYAKSIRAKRIDQVDTDDILAIIRPIWLEKSTTARTVRSYLERVLDAAKARGFRSGENPARFKGHLDTLLAGGTASKRTVKHHAAMPYIDLPKFMADLRTRPAIAARALEFTILTAARTSEALEATWSELDLEAATWTIPATRMKARQQHTVPLSQDCITLLQTLKSPDASPDHFVFGKGVKAPSNMAMTMLMRRMSLGHFTVHGMRSAFRDFAGDRTDFPREVAEAALAHTVGGVEGAYRRGRALDKRRALMKAWANYLSGTRKSIFPVLAEAPKPIEVPVAMARKRAAKAEADEMQTSLLDLSS